MTNTCNKKLYDMRLPDWDKKAVIVVHTIVPPIAEVVGAITAVPVVTIVLTAPTVVTTAATTVVTTVIGEM